MNLLILGDLWVLRHWNQTKLIPDPSLPSSSSRFTSALVHVSHLLLRAPANDTEVLLGWLFFQWEKYSHVPSALCGFLPALLLSISFHRASWLHLALQEWCGSKKKMNAASFPFSVFELETWRFLRRFIFGSSLDRWLYSWPQGGAASSNYWLTNDYVNILYHRTECGTFHLLLFAVVSPRPGFSRRGWPNETDYTRHTHTEQ